MAAKLIRDRRMREVDDNDTTRVPIWWDKHPSQIERDDVEEHFIWMEMPVNMMVNDAEMKRIQREQIRAILARNKAGVIPRHYRTTVYGV